MAIILQRGSNHSLRILIANVKSKYLSRIDSNCENLIEPLDRKLL